MENEQGFFDFAAYVGLTKHLGGLEATDALAALCHLGKGKYILDIGCGVGATPCYLAKQYGCRVVGVDINEAMIVRSRERAEQQHISEKVEFRVADAQDLPFKEGLFDAVITESVTAFPEDKQLAVNEYRRVIKAGGYVGMNESTWLKVPPPPEVVAWASQDVGANVQPLTPEEWEALMQHAGLSDIVVKTYAIDTRSETKGIIQRYGYGGMVRTLWRALLLYTRNPAYRRFLRHIRGQGIVPENLEEYFGYGIYVGRK